MRFYNNCTFFDSSKIFGNRHFKGGGDFGDFDFADTKFGFGAAQEVTLNLTFAQAARGTKLNE